MLTETWGGKCPVCGFDRILMRYGSTGYYQLDACPRCGFAYGTNMQDIVDTDPMEVWKAVLEAEQKFLKAKNLPKSIDGIYKWVMSFEGIPDKERDSTFLYTDEHIEKYKESNLYKSRMHRLKEMVVFT
jgi:hypothetical protein